MIRYCADFETTTDPDDCRVWLWCAIDIDNTDRRFYGTDIQSFFKWLPQKGLTEIYFHNLKFDGQFLLWYLLHETDFPYDESGAEHTFHTLIGDSGIFYMIEMILSKHNKHVDKIKFLDSYKKLPFTVKKISKDFGIEETKGEIDYTKPRPVGYAPDDNEIEYVTNDVLIVCKALKQQFDQELTKMTISSDGLNFAKGQIGKKRWNELFPVLDVAIDDDIRRSYKGGAVQVHPEREGKTVYNGASFDVNSMYPWAMLQPMPCGVPIFYEGRYKHDPDYPLYIQHILCEFKIKPGYIPTIQIKNNLSYQQNKYLTESVEQTHLYLTSVDLTLFFRSLRCLQL